jgi:DNA-binding CsgD family transcriptional regulator
MPPRDATTRVRPFRPAGSSDADIPYVEVLSGVLRGRVFALEPGSNMVGRGSAQVVLDCDGVSRRHANLTVSSDGVVTLVDLESTNGTFVNGARIDRMALRESDRIQIGPDVALRFGYRRAGDDGGSAAPPPSTREPDDLELTARELEIAQLVADGLSNAAIGKRLFISARTVGTHLSNMYKRLEIHTRAELTRYVLERTQAGR